MSSRRAKRKRSISPPTGVNSQSNGVQQSPKSEVAAPNNSNPETAGDRSAPLSTADAPHEIDDRREIVTLWLRRADQFLLGFLLIALLILLVAFRWKLSGGWRTPIEIVDQYPREFVYRIEINKASWVEWAQLDGIGEKLARRIIQDRHDHGPFRSIDDLRRVRGLGPKLIEKLRPYLSCENEESETPARTAEPFKELR